MIMKFFIITGVFSLFLSCSSDAQIDRSVVQIEKATVQINDNKKKEYKDVVKEVMQFPIDSVFVSLDTNFKNKTLLLPEGFKAEIIFKEKDRVVVNDSVFAPAKGNHDMLAYLPISDTRGTLFVSHELKSSNAILGDGGGATMFDVQSQNGKWEVTSPYYHVDFSGVRGTDRNCGGSVAPNGMIYTCEEHQGKTNTYFYRNGKGHLDTTDVGDLKFYENIGYVVEVDPKTRKATQKMYAMGCYFHEDLEFMDDRKTVYLSDDKEPGVWFKFIADSIDDYSKGQLYAYKQSVDGESGSWITLPRDMASLVRIREIAIERGASVFMRHEWMVRKGDLIYIAETGHDHTDWTKPIKKGAVPAKHYRDNLNVGGNIYEDVYGRVLVFNTQTNKMSVLLEGGVSSDGKTVFSNPDCITITTQKGKDYLVICEDINRNNKGRVPKHSEMKNQWYNELYFLDLSIGNPKVDDLARFAITPMGAEFTGAIFTKDNKTMFLNVQHPNWSNGKPYNRSSTVVITGW